MDDFLITSGPDALRQLIEEAKPPLFWEIEDIAALPEYKRFELAQRLLEKLADMEPIEIFPWKKLFHEKLAISASDFKAQLKVARQEKQIENSNAELDSINNNLADKKQGLASLQESLARLKELAEDTLVQTKQEVLAKMEEAK